MGPWFVFVRMIDGTQKSCSLGGWALIRVVLVRIGVELCDNHVCVSSTAHSCVSLKDGWAINVMFFRRMDVGLFYELC